MKEKKKKWLNFESVCPQAGDSLYLTPAIALDKPQKLLSQNEQTVVLTLRILTQIY